ncbi:GAF domain-containing protein [Alteromonas sp. H39]|uniref:GAF domain-containing protein n=1 Tax=Alteromonas sp. H39 TaxID=3389876 RepID=UPI0039E13B75
MVDIDPLTELTIKLSRQTLTAKSKYTAICRCVLQCIPKTNRVSLWKFDDARSSIHCLMLLTDEGKPEEPDIVLTQLQYPDYFSAIIQRETVTASDARNHPDTRCFAKDYFRNNDIFSMLDFIFHHDFRPVGIICCESVGEQVEWDNMDESMLRRTASIVSMFFDER